MNIQRILSGLRRAAAVAGAAGLLVGASASCESSSSGSNNEGIADSGGSTDTGQSDTAQAADVVLPSSTWEEVISEDADLGDLKKTYAEAKWFEFMTGVLLARLPAGAALAQVDGAKEAADPYVQGNKDRYDHLMEHASPAVGAMCSNFAAKNGAAGQKYVILADPAHPVTLDATGVTTSPRSSIASQIPGSLFSSLFRELLLTGDGGSVGMFGILTELDCDTYGLLASTVASELMTTDTALLDRERAMMQLVYLKYYLRTLREELPLQAAAVRGVAGFEQAIRDVVERAVWAVEISKPYGVFLLATDALEEVYANEDVLGQLELFLAAE